MRKIYNIIHYILIVILTQIISIIWLSYFIKQSNTLLILSLIISCITIIIIYKSNIKKQAVKYLNNQNNIAYEKFKHKLLYSNIEESLNILSDIIELKNTKINKTKKCIISIADKTIYIPYLSDETLTKKDFFEIIQTHINKYSKIIIYCFDYSENIKELFNVDFLANNIHVVTLKNLFLLNSDKINQITDNYIINNTYTKKQIYNKIKTNLFQTNKWKTYLFYGITLFILNRFNSNKIYLSIFTTLFLILAIICLIKKLLTKN